MIIFSAEITDPGAVKYGSEKDLVYHGVYFWLVWELFMINVSNAFCVL